ncbi:hypothetical protein [Kordiimonas laminariae]|uniref:hypothetical protein n=1 Tax=Kordiimonas laminariae TaxID=2917717 RepID=UPI001FF3C316|nr:hypothetical protein [Kordiimonas laminariae]MCK0070694.1 hypothetical protein [Kordiimonas laminariae]
MGKLIVIIMLLMVTACDNQTNTFNVNGSVFEIPNKFLVQGDIFFLPPSQHSYPIVKLYPEMDRLHYIGFIIKPMRGLCSSLDGKGYNMLPNACASVAQGVKKTHHIDLKGLVKTYPYENNLNWLYQIQRVDGTEDVISCGTIGRNNTCSSFGIYHDMIYTVRYLEEDIPNLNKIHQDVYDRLTEWEK